MHGRTPSGYGSDARMEVKIDLRLDVMYLGVK